MDCRVGGGDFGEACWLITGCLFNCILEASMGQSDVLRGQLLSLRTDRKSDCGGL